MGEAEAVDLAIARLTCAYAMVFGFGGLPLLYMGDELGMLNDHTYLDDPAKSADNRWVHRPAMDWSLAEGHVAEAGVADRVFSAIVNLIRARRSLPALHASVGTEAFTTENPAVLVFRRRHAAGTIVQVYNLSESHQALPTSALWPLTGELVDEHLTGIRVPTTFPPVLPPYAAWWLTSPA
jgi:amylosucrase